MPQAVIIPEEREPSYFNKQGITGAKVGLLGALGLTAAAAAAALNPLFAALGAGALVAGCSGAGCVRGKEVIARNKETGRKVHPPSILNEGLLQGILNGAILGLAGIAATLAFATAPWAVPLAAGLGLGATAFLGYAQGKTRQATMAVQYENAKAKATQMEPGLFGQAVGHAQDLASGVAKGIGNTVRGAGNIAKDASNTFLPKITPDEFDELERRTSEASKTREWAEKIQELEADREASR